jgi:hypothetical protein
MSDENDSWLEGIGVDVAGVLQTAESSFGDINAVADVSAADLAAPGSDEEGGIGEGIMRAGGTAVRIAQTVGQFGVVAGAVGGGAAAAVTAAGVAAGVIVPIAVGYLLEHGEELQQQPDPDDQRLPGGAPPAQSGGDGPSDGGALPPVDPGDAGAP